MSHHDPDMPGPVALGNSGYAAPYRRDGSPPRSAIANYEPGLDLPVANLACAVSLCGQFCELFGHKENPLARCGLRTCKSTANACRLILNNFQWPSEERQVFHRAW